ncbi:DUF4309 domain-containing protein [Bacillus sp. FJAT-49711]|uniref:DUF4309 domain-containing protein n=1 Tax=Bacillus sp. FJAT-49711 TaxID=2833585 RepID=UPI001BC9E89A|nr:DUF4309 domain-containing protein [Bacillus sp. FJAT-49711]MBS4219154.1 DUF4309 domain-containing protein [Bacillus sp. FJAT-49711]
MKKSSCLIISIILLLGLGACDQKKVDEANSQTDGSKSNAAENKETDASQSNAAENDETNDSPSNESETEENHSDEAGSKEEQEVNDSESEEGHTENQSVESEQKQMAIDTLNDLVKDAKDGRVYKLGDGIYIGKTKRDEVYELIGEPEEKENGFERYHGSMGNASYDLAYDDGGVLKEARYRGTNVERQTNLGGITVQDLKEQIREPDEIRKISKTDEINYIYRLGLFELQFVMGPDGTADHVNIMEQ